MAVVQGYCLGGHNHMAYCCDFTIAADNAKFGQAGPKVSSPADGFFVPYLTKVVGAKKAREMWMLCRRYPAEQALWRWASSNKVVPSTMLWDEVDRVVRGAAGEEPGLPGDPQGEPSTRRWTATPRWASSPASSTPTGSTCPRARTVAFELSREGRPGLAASGCMIYRFGEHSIDDECLELRRWGRILEVQPKVLDLLIYLIRERERVVSRRELLDRLWGDAEVVDGSAHDRRPRGTRAVLGDSADRQWAIKTVQRRRGYRFVAPLDEAPGSRRGFEPLPPEPGPVDGGCLRRAGGLAWRASKPRSTRPQQGADAPIVVTGESGIGKTRLLDELASRAGKRGEPQVLAAWCYEGEGSSSLLALGADASNRDRGAERPQDALLDMGAGAADLAALVPAIHELRPDLPGTPSAPVRAPPVSDCSRASPRSSRTPAKRRPILILVDDLHSADHASLRLLSFLAHEVRHARILAVVTVRAR